MVSARFDNRRLSCNVSGTINCCGLSSSASGSANVRGIPHIRGIWNKVLLVTVIGHTDYSVSPRLLDRLMTFVVVERMNHTYLAYAHIRGHEFGVDLASTPSRYNY